MKRKKKTTSSKPKKKKTVAPKANPKSQGCDVCGMEVSEIHCRLVCPKCGATRDCSDP